MWLGKKDFRKTRRYVMRMKKHWDLRKILGLVDLRVHLFTLW